MSDQQPVASSGPAGLGALGAICFGFGAVFFGWVKVEGLPLLAAWLIGGGIVQFVVAMNELKHNNISGGNVFLFFAAFFMFAAALSTIAKFLMIKSGMAPDPYIEGWCWLAGASFLTLVTPAYLKVNKILFFVIVLADIILFGIAGLDLGIFPNPAMVKTMLGAGLMLVGWMAIYMAGAIIVNTTFGKAIFPIPAPFVK
ncbi:MAG: acetate uptake transporter family protein [Smithellaceae bacterium]